MTSRGSHKPYIIPGNISEVLKNKRERSNYTFCFNPSGFSGYLVNGEIVSEKDFDNMFPVLLKPKALKGKNYDKTKNWMFNEQSY